MKKLALLSLALSAVLLGGCNGSSEPAGNSTAANGEKKLTVGFSQIGAESDWRTAETKSIQSEAETRGVNLKFSDANESQENQIKALHSFIAQKVDGIILAPKVETGWEPVLKEAKEANIPVVLVDRGVTVSDDSLYATLIASDFVEEGRRAAKFLVDKMGGKGNIVELEGSPGAAPAIDRKKGFDEVIGQNPGMKILVSQTGDFKRTQGKEVMEAFLKAHGKNINAVYAHNDDMALGAIQAIEEAGMKPGVDILVVSIDGIHDALQAIADGKLNCTIECNPLLGPAAFDAIQKAVKGESLEKKTIVQDQQFDQSNAAKALPDRKY